jgi:hypothetical protein
MTVVDPGGRNQRQRSKSTSESTSKAADKSVRPTLSLIGFASAIFLDAINFEERAWHDYSAVAPWGFTCSIRASCSIGAKCRTRDRYSIKAECNIRSACPCDPVRVTEPQFSASLGCKAHCKHVL